MALPKGEEPLGHWTKFVCALTWARIFIFSVWSLGWYLFRWWKRFTMFPVLVGIDRQHILQTVLMCALSLLRYPNHFHIIDVVFPFLSTTSSALEDNTSSLSPLLSCPSVPLIFHLYSRGHLLSHPISSNNALRWKWASTLTCRSKTADWLAVVRFISAVWQAVRSIHMEEKMSKVCHGYRHKFYHDPALRSFYRLALLAHSVSHSYVHFVLERKRWGPPCLLFRLTGLLCDAQVILNLSQVLDKQKEKLEKMKVFTHWRLQHTEAKEEVHWWHCGVSHSLKTYLRWYYSGGGCLFFLFSYMYVFWEMDIKLLIVKVSR